MTKKTKPIDAENLTAYERWELPALSGKNTARRSGSAVKPPTASEIEAIHREAYESGFNEGREAGQKSGYEAGIAEGRQVGIDQGREEGRALGRQEMELELNAVLERLQKMILELTHPMQDCRDELGQSLLNMVLAISRSVIQRELQQDSRHIGVLVKQLLDTLPSPNGAIRIRLNPRDMEWVLPVIQADDRQVDLVGDEQVMAGGCQIDNDHSVLDYTVEKRFQKLVQSMLASSESLQESDKAESPSGVMEEMSDFHRELMESEIPSAQGSTISRSGDSDSSESDLSISDPATSDPDTTEDDRDDLD